MAKFIDITNQKFGKLTVKGLSDQRGSQNKLLWECVCDCGNTNLIYSHHLRYGKSRSCGRCFNACRVEGAVAYITIESQIHGAVEFTVDAEDLETLKKGRWYLNSSGYVSGTYNNILLSRFLMNPREEELVDHIDMNKLNNCKSNLRLCSRAENLWNRGPTKNNSTGYKNVHWHKFIKKYFVKIMKDGQSYYSRYYDDIEEAVRHADQKRQELHGEFARKEAPADVN